MSESTADTSDKTSETSDSSESESESESESSEESSDATPKAESGDDEISKVVAGVTTSTTSAATDASKSAEEAATIPEPPPPTPEVKGENVLTTEASEEFSITLHTEDESASAPSTVPSSADVEQPAAATTTELTEEKTESPPSPEIKVDKVARVVGQTKSDITSKPETTTDTSEVQHVYQQTVVQKTQVRI